MNQPAPKPVMDAMTRHFNQILEIAATTEHVMEPSEIFDAAMEAEGVYATEGNRGVEALNKMAKMLGYGDPHQHSLEAMLADNSGMIEAMFKWARDNLSQEQMDRLESYIPADDESQ